MRPNLLVIRVSDLTAARNFYETLGIEFRMEKHGSGPEHFTYAKDGFVFEVYPRRSASDSTSAARIGFSVPSLGSILTKLAAIGAEVVAEARESEWGWRAVVRDLDGHTVELLEVGWAMGDLQIVDPEALARRNPAMFGLRPDTPDWGKALTDRLVHDTRSEYCEISARQVEGWWIVSASRDWLGAPDGSLDLSFFRTAKPLKGQVNSCRVEWLIHAYARTLITAGPSGRTVLKGTVSSASPIWKTIADVGATRVLAFEGIEAERLAGSDG